MGRDEITDALSIRLVDPPELARLHAAPHRVELELGGQQAPAVILAEHAVTTFDRWREIVGGFDAIQCLAKRLDFGVEVMTQEFDEQFIFRLEVRVERTPGEAGFLSDDVDGSRFETRAAEDPAGSLDEALARDFPLFGAG